MKKRLMSAFLAFVMIFTIVPFNAFAADVQETNAVVSIKNTTAEPGNTVTVNVVIENNPGILGMTLKLNFDDSIATLKSVKSGDALSAMSFTPPTGDALVSGCNLVWDAEEVKAEDIKDGVIAMLTFEIAEEAIPGDFVDIDFSYNKGAIRDSAFSAIDVSIASGRISILDYTPGDLNESGNIDSTDVVFLRRYIAGGYMFDGKPITINEFAADVDDNDYLDSTDIVSIRRNIAGGYGVELLPHTEKCKHTSLTAVPAKEATCTEDGNIEYWYCSDCGKYFEDEEATAQIENVVVEKTGHTEVPVSGYDSTFDQEGLTDGIKCSACQTWIIEQITIPKKEVEKATLVYYNNGESNSVSYKPNELFTLSTIPSVAIEGYDFKGWFTEPEGEGKLVKLIPVGNPDNIQIVYAYWTPHIYTISFTNANGYKSEGIEYTIESKDIYLNTKPEWKYLIFTGWKDDTGKLEYVNDTPVIKTGTIGNIVLDATWKTKQNIFNLPEKPYSNAAFNKNDGNYYFFYHLGNVENVLLQPKEGTGRDHGTETTLTTSKTVEVSQSTAREQASSVTNATKVSFENTFESTVTTELSTTVGASATVGAEVDGFFAKGTASATASTEVTAGASWGATVGGSYSEDNESSQTNEFSSTISYMETSSITEETTITLSSDDPQGKYYFLPAGTFEIYSVVLYDPITKELKFDVYSKHIDTYPFTLYVPYSTEVKVNPEMDGIPYDFLEEVIKEKILNSLFVFYDPGYNDVEIDEEKNIVSANYTINGNEYLPTCDWYSREGYVFDGWQVCGADGTVLLEKLEGGSEVSKLAECADENNKVFKLKAIWSEVETINLEQTNVENADSTTIIYTVPAREKAYKDEACTHEITNISIPERTGYTFGGYYNGETECISYSGEIRNEIYSITSENELKIKWNGNEYSVTFVDNEGNIMADSIKVVCGQKYGELPTAVKDGYTFFGWCSNDDSLITEDTIVTITNDHILTACWSENSYNMVYCANKPTGASADVSNLPDPGICYYDKNVKLSSTIPTLSGWNFEGWYKDSDCTEKIGDAGCEIIAPNYTAEANGTVSLYAKWTPKEHIVNFDPNASSIKTEPTNVPSSQKVTYDSSFEFGVPTATYFYQFDGWYTTPGGEGTQLTDSKGKSINNWDIAGDTTVYARWSKSYPDYTYIANEDDLKNIKNNTSGKYYMVKDITLKNSWTPLPEFFGILDGQGHVIKNWSYNQTEVGSIGLFTKNSGKITNLKISDFKITTNQSANITGTLKAGLICGENSGTGTLSLIYISSSTIHVDVGDIDVDGNNSIYVGMACGYNDGTIDSVYVTGTAAADDVEIRADASANDNNDGSMGHAEVSAGGIAGYSSKTISSCTVENCRIESTCNTTAFHNMFTNHHGAPRARTGGIVGHSVNGAISYCSSTKNKVISTCTRQCDHKTNMICVAAGVVGHSQGTSVSNNTITGNGVIAEYYFNEKLMTESGYSGTGSHIGTTE